MSVRRTVIGIAILAALLIGGLWWRATWVVNHLLHADAARAIAEKSNDVYRLEVGRVRLNALHRRIAVDSVNLTTNEAINAQRPRPRTTLRLAFHDCIIAGTHLFTLITGRGLIAESFGCADVRAAAQVPPPNPSGRDEPDTAASPATLRQAFFIMQQGLRLPRFAPLVQVARIDFPHAELDLRLQWARGEAARLQLDHLEWHMTDFTVDPADSAAMNRPLFSRTVDISATDFVASRDSAAAVRVAAFHMSLPDSTVAVRGIAFVPTISDSAFARARLYRRSLLRVHVGGIAVRGLDVGALALGAGVRATRMQADSLRVDVLTDRRRPPDPRRPVRRTPQRWIADLERTVSVDSVLVHGGEVVYREQRARHLKPGVVTFARLEAVAVNVRHFVGRRTARDLMTLHASAHLQDEGRLDAQFVAPLDAPRFAMSVRGTLGSMAAARLNPFIQETSPLRLSKGRILGITFDATVVNGVAAGTITPRYHDLAIEVTGRGAKGILGGGGVIGDAARGIATFLGNAAEINDDNPDDGETVPRTGTINHTFTPNETLPAFLWASIRDGLFSVMRK
jgi:hypothetical protein